MTGQMTPLDASCSTPSWHAHLALLRAPADDQALVVSVFLTTVPASRMRPRDGARLDALLRRLEHAAAARQVDSQQDGADLDGLLRRVRRLAELASRAPVRRSIALFAGGEVDRMVNLPQPVFDRVVVDRAYDVRDLLYADQCNPAFRVLSVQDGLARLFDSRHDETLIERRDRFPVAGGHGVDDDAFLARMAAELAVVDRDDPRPLVLAVDDPAGRIASAVPSWVEVFAGTIDRTDDGGPAHPLQRAARRCVTAWHRQGTLAMVPAPGEPGWVGGVDDVHRGVLAQPRGLLLVEANLHDGPARGVRIVDSGRPGDGALNRSVSRVGSAGGRVVFVDDGSLHAWQGIAFAPVFSPLEARCTRA